MIEFILLVLASIPFLIGFYIGKSIGYKNGYNSSIDELQEKDRIISKIKEFHADYEKEANRVINSSIAVKNALQTKKSIINIDVSKYEEKNDLSNIDELLDELNKLVGLNMVKNEVNTIINTLKIKKIRENKGLSQTAMSMHLVFSGNPGTGKTTVARIMAKIYCRLGFLSKGHLTEVDRSSLVAGYVGQTAIKTQEIVEKAKGGILFIDEAYSLTVNKGDSDYGYEAVDTLLKAMEDFRGDFIVIVAGYPNLMKDFLKSNPGLQSRFNTFVHFEDYNAEELCQIFMGMCKRDKYLINEDDTIALKQHFYNLYLQRNENYANARDVRNYFENILKRQSNRLAMDNDLTDEELVTLTKEDLFEK